jgi:uncharacterized protein involved in exopolysaccharide biosynthesis
MHVDTSEVEISLADAARTVARRVRMIASVTVAAAGIGAAVVMLLPVYYSAEAVILPPQPDQPMQSMLMGSLSGLSGLGLLGGGGGSALFRNPGELYAGLLKSRTVADAVIARFQLKSLYGNETMVDTRKRLARLTTIETGRDLLIHVRVEDREPARAAAMANAYVDELHRQNSRLALTAAGQRRLFFEERVRKESETLADAKAAMRNMQQASGLVYPAGQSEALLRSIAQLRAEIASREVQAQAMRLYAAPENPQLRANQEVTSALHAQLDKLEKTGEGAGDPLVPARRIPQAALEYLRKARDVKYHETLFGLLSQQAEAARLDEARESPVVQVLDRAQPPDKKSWPPRVFLVALATVAGAIAASAIALFQAHRAGGVYARF